MYRVEDGWEYISAPKPLSSLTDVERRSFHTAVHSYSPLNDIMNTIADDKFRYPRQEYPTCMCTFARFTELHLPSDGAFYSNLSDTLVRTNYDDMLISDFCEKFRCNLFDSLQSTLSHSSRPSLGCISANVSSHVRTPIRS